MPYRKKIRQSPISSQKKSRAISRGLKTKYSTGTLGSNTFMGCNGENVMIQNYMNCSDDEIMCIFTLDQIKRMHYVLKHHAGRNALLSSPALQAF